MLQVGFIRRIVADAVITVSVMVRFVDRHIQRNPVAVVLEYHRTVISEFIGHAGITPAALIADIVRQIIMDQRDVGHDAVFFTRVQHAVIEGQTGRIDDMIVFRQNA